MTGRLPVIRRPIQETPPIKITPDSAARMIACANQGAHPNGPTWASHYVEHHQNGAFLGRYICDRCAEALKNNLASHSKEPTE